MDSNSRTRAEKSNADRTVEPNPVSNSWIDEPLDTPNAHVAWCRMGTGTRRTRGEKESGDCVHPLPLRHSVPCAGLAFSSSRRLVLVLGCLFDLDSRRQMSGHIRESLQRESAERVTLRAFGPTCGGRALPRSAFGNVAPRGEPCARRAATRRPRFLNELLYFKRAAERKRSGADRHPCRPSPNTIPS